MSLLLLRLQPSWASDEDHHKENETHGEHEDEEHEEGGEEEAMGGIGKEMAVTAFDLHQGLKISPEAVTTLKIQTASFDGEIQNIPSSALVHYEKKTRLYRYENGWYQLVDLVDLKSGDQIVINGAPFLRIAELDAQSGDEAGHGH
jgi:hypothetical protein